jgi:hypothetical protein
MKYRVSERTYSKFNEAAGKALKASLEAQDPIDIEVLNSKGEHLYYIIVSGRQENCGA